MEFETLASGYGLIEGPRIDAADRLYFSDVTNGGVFCRAPDGEISTVVPKRKGVGGIALHADGGLVISGRNVCHVRDGETRVVFARPDIPGFNDLFTDAAGRVYVGSLRSNPFAEAEAPIPGELYRIDIDGSATALYEDVRLTNGIGFAPEGKRLYHTDTARRAVLAHEFDGERVTSTRVFAQVRGGGPDGLAVDEEGFVWVAVFGGGSVQRFSPDGSLAETVAVPARSVTSVCFGGADRRDLYVVSADNTDDPAKGGSVFRARVPVAGLAAPLARV